MASSTPSMAVTPLVSALLTEVVALSSAPCTSRTPSAPSRRAELASSVAVREVSSAESDPSTSERAELTSDP